MRFTSALIATVLTAFAGAASAQTLQQISFSPAFEDKVQDDLGAREGELLRRVVSERVIAELAERGIAADAAARIDISIVDAEPNRPTMQQVTHQPGLDSMRSISIGGAELHAVLRGADGQVLTEVEHRYYTHSLDDIVGEPLTWTDARRSIYTFAEKVADAYAGLH